MASHFLFTRFARPSGQPAAVTTLRSVCSRERESNQRESAPGIRVSLRSTPLAPVLLRGSSRWASPGPSFLVWHPCQTPLSTAPMLGLLTGFGDRVVWAICGQQKQKSKSIAAMGRSYGFIACRAGETRHAFCFSTSDFTDDAKRPIRRPSGIVAEGVERHGCRESRDGPGMALRGVPLEQ